MKATETKAERWCVHIPGPDDLYAQPSKEAADKLAAEHNRVMGEWYDSEPRGPHYPVRESIMAEVIEWPHEPVSDAEWEAMCEEDADGD